MKKTYLMKPPLFSFRLTALLQNVLIGLTLVPCVAIAETDAAPASVERLHQTTLGILEALVNKGILTQTDADAIVSSAKAKAMTAPPAQANEPKPAEAPTVRVPFVPEIVKRELREEIRKEVVAQARAERWVQPDALPEWISRIKVSGDVRVRLQTDRIAGSSGAAVQYFDNEDVTNFVGLRNTENQNRARIRARLAIDSEISDKVQAGLRLSTGNLTSPVSTSSTSGDASNRFGVKLDRAFIRYSPLTSLQLEAGRMTNPFMGADLAFAPEMGFDGFAVKVKPKLDDTFSPFATIGAFPLRNEAFSGNRKLTGAQLGADWSVTDKVNFKFALARYRFDGAVGTPLFDSTSPAYNSTEYESGYRQRGNTLFRINQDPFVSASPVYGLASQFNVNSLFASLELKHFDPTRLVLTAETITNRGFNEQEIAQRVGIGGISSRNHGYMVRMSAGSPRITKRGEWQLGFGVRKLERDATLDALTDPDFVLGGTNVKGQFVSFSYGIEKNTELGLRYMSGETIDAPLSNVGLQPLKVRTLQLDMNVRF